VSKVVRLIFAILLLFVGTATVDLSNRADAQGTDSHTFPETGQTVKGLFWKYWQEHGGLAQQGYPISAEMQEKSDLNGKTYTVQYFERAVFELHPENQSPYDVLLSQLGTFRYKQKYPGGAPEQRPNGDPGTVIFPETGRALGGSFLAYWRSSGGVAQQGYPISEEFQEKSDLNGKTYTVQYFERAVFEFHPENQPPYHVLLSQLGTFRYGDKYAKPPQPPPSGTVRDWIAPVNISRSKIYNNVPSIAASPLTGDIMVGWEQRDEPAGKNNTLIVTFKDPNEVLRPQSLQTTGFKQTGGVKVARDKAGRRHVVWWGQTGTTVCNYYTLFEADGRLSAQETVPGTCGRQQKLTALAIGPDNVAHAIFGRDGQAVYYYRRDTSGAWGVKEETIASGGVPTNVALTVSTGGVVMAAYRTGASSAESDIYAGTRGSNGQWAMENMSSDCCAGCPGDSHAYNPTLAPDPSGGIRALWADEQCEPRTDPRQNDLYYREWVPNRGWTGAPARIVRDPGDAFESALVVDSTGMAHIVYTADAGTRVHGQYRPFYTSGSGGNFAAPIRLFSSFGANASFQKSPALDYSAGWLHLVFNSDHESEKEVYYSNKGLGR
jgi:hypothetical protein